MEMVVLVEIAKFEEFKLQINSKKRLEYSEWI